jgi:hypothetical protein
MPTILDSPLNPSMILNALANPVMAKIVKTVGMTGSMNK